MVRPRHRALVVDAGDDLATMRPLVLGLEGRGQGAGEDLVGDAHLSPNSRPTGRVFFREISLICL